MTRRVLAVLGVAASVAGCVWRGTPVPVSGDLAALAGRWSGGYSSSSNGRSGSIVFALVAGTDSAYGDVLMVPTHQGDVTRPGTAPRPQEGLRAPTPLRIAFVRSDHGEVAGALEPYPDPETGVRLHTTFHGRLTDGEFRGTYTTWAEGADRPTSGEWSAGRVKDE